METQEEKTKKEPRYHGISVKQRIVAESNKAGYTDISDYIDHLIGRINELEEKLGILRV